MILHIKVKAGARVNQLSKDTQANFILKIKAPPIDGKANEEVIRFLSEVLRIPKSMIILESGFTNSHKKFQIKTLREEEVFSKLNQVTQ